MTFRNVLLAAGVVALGVSCANASIETRVVNITNPTSTPWSRVIFYFIPQTIADPARFNPIHFVDSMALQVSPQNPVSKLILDAPTNDVLAFDYTGFTPLAPTATHQFSLTVDNPFDEPFTIGWRTVRSNVVPAPAGMAAGLLGVMASARRRR